MMKNNKIQEIAKQIKKAKTIAVFTHTAMVITKFF